MNFAWLKIGILTFSRARDFLRFKLSKTLGVPQPPIGTELRGWWPELTMSISSRT